MGVIGIGHWFKRLEAGLEKVGGIKVVKAVGTKPYEAKAEMLKSLGIESASYYIIGSDGTIPPAFFENVDIVHISNPPEFHSSQIRQALSKGKKVAVEKAYGTTRTEFDDVKKYLKEGGLEKSVYLHLHYIHKLPSLQLRKSIKELIQKNGKITGITTTFFERADEEDARRQWLFGTKNGGIFMDLGIHQFEVAHYTTGASFGRIEKLNLYTTNESYDSVNPTGIMVELGLKGKRFADNAKMTVRMAKGIDPKYSKKSMLFTFESGTYIRLEYVGSESESKDSRGGFETGRVINGSRVADSVTPLSGRGSSEFFVKDILKLCKGKRAGLSMAQAAKIFRPQWDYQRLSKKQALIKDAKQTELFLENGIKEL